MSTRRLIEDWLPIAALSAECEREGSAALKPPVNRLHVWWARRPLVASRAAILGSLLEAGADQTRFLHSLGIHGDPVATRLRIGQAKVTSTDLGADPYGYPRAFQHFPERGVTGKILDPTAGGGSIPFEAIRLGCETICNDLNPVAALLLKATVELPATYGTALLKRYEELSAEFQRRVVPRFAGLFPKEAENVVTVVGYLWARTVSCPYCGGLVPLSPSWKLSGSGHGVRLIASLEKRSASFEIVERESDHSPGTVKGGDGICPFPDCRRIIDGNEIKAQAQAGYMGHQLYCVVYKQERLKGYTKSGKPKIEKVRGFRAPRPEDGTDAVVERKLREKMPLWRARNIVPDEEFPPDTSDDRPRQYGAPLWRDLFNPRQLYGHCVSVEVFHELVEECVKTDLDRAAMAHIALALDKMLNYNAIQVRWHANRELVAGVFDRHDFSFKWSYAEIAPTITGLGYEWAFKETAKSLDELIVLLGKAGHCVALHRVPLTAPDPNPEPIRRQPYHSRGIS